MFNTSVYWNNQDLSRIPKPNTVGQYIGLKIITYNVTDMPNRTLNSSKLARSNKSLLTSAEYTDKSVTVTGMVGGANATEQQDFFDMLKARIQEPEGIIRVQQGSKTVEYTGTLNSITKTPHGQNLEFILEFKCADPIGKDFSTLNLINPTTITTATQSISMTVDGSFLAQPRFTIVINAVTGGTAKTIQLLNSETGKGIKITRTWTVGDIVTISSDALEVTVNSTLVDFKGQFPSFLPGTRTLQYIDDFTTRTILLSAIYQRKYA